MDAEVNVTGKILVRDCTDFWEKLNSFSVAQNPGASLAAYSLVLDAVEVLIRVVGCCPDVDGKPVKALPTLRIKGADDMSDDDVGALCRKLSGIFGCAVVVCRDRELFGVENVYNGGSDFAVVNEECLVCAFDREKQVLFERTDHWNDAVNLMEREFLAGETAGLLLARFKA